MSDITKQIAILIFANSSMEELKNKPIAYGQNLFNYFNSQTLKKVRKTNLPFVLCSEKDQCGATFAERFTNAIAALFDKGYEKIITIGNDSPNLRSADIIEASKKLVDNDIVIGPSMDGGIYLMGLHKGSFIKKNFLQLPWQTNQLAKTLINTILDNGLVLKSLRYLRDIDTIHDLKRFSRYTRHLSLIFKHILLTIFETSFIAILFREGFVPRIVTSVYFNKGSPSLTS